jgi:hypothetical protein
VASCPTRILLPVDVSQPSIAQGRTKSIAEIIDCGSNCHASVLPHVICYAKIIEYLQQIKKMRINALMQISTIIAII